MVRRSASCPGPDGLAQAGAADLVRRAGEQYPEARLQDPVAVSLTARQDTGDRDHYRNHPAGVECIDIIEGMPLCVGLAIKYLWRLEQKGSPIEDLIKARWYIDRELKRRQGAQGKLL